MTTPLILLFSICYLLQLGLNVPAFIPALLPQTFKSFLYDDIRLWTIPFIFILLFFFILFIQYFLCILYNFYFQSLNTRQSLRQVASRFNITFSNIFIFYFILSIVGFIILLLHERNGSVNYNISAEIFNVLRDHQSLFTYNTTSSSVLIILCLLLLFSFIYFIQKSLNNNNIFSISLTFVGLFFTSVSLYYCNNLLLLIFLLEILLLFLLNLLRIQNFFTNVGSFLKTVLIFVIAQALATVIYCYGLSLIYVQNPSLSFSTITLDIQMFKTFYFETHQFVITGSTYLLIALLIKMGLGPLGLWIFFSVSSFTYPFIALYFSFIKPLYFTIIVKMLGNVFGPLYAIQGLIKHPSNLSVTDSKLLEYFKFELINQTYKSNSNSELLKEVSNNIELNTILINTQILRDNISTFVLAFSVFSIIVGAFGLLTTNDIKKFIAYSSMLNYGFVFYPVISGYLSSVHYSVLYILSYSLINLLFIWTFNYLFSDKQTSISNLSIYSSSKSMFSLFLVSLIVSMAGLPPFLGFFTKTAVLFELIKILGIYTGSIFIFFTLIGAFGYARLIKNMYGIIYNTISHGILFSLRITSFVFNPIFYITIFIFIFTFILNTFLGYYLVYIIKGDILSIFNSFVFTSHSSVKGNFIEHNLLQILVQDYGIDINELDKFLKNFATTDSQFINTFIEHQADLFSRRTEILTGTSATEQQLTQFKFDLKRTIDYKLRVYTIGEGFSYTNLHMECAKKFI